MDRRNFLKIAGGATAASLFMHDIARPQRRETQNIQLMGHYCNWLTKQSMEALATVIPLRGSYNSDDPDIIREHNNQFTRYGIVPLISWWGRNSPNGDRFLDIYMSINSNVKAGLLYEASGLLVSDSTRPFQEYDFNYQENSDRFVSDIDHINRKYFTRFPERFHKINNKPVVFIWLSSAFKGPFQNAVNRARGVADFYLMGSNFNMGGSIPRVWEEFLPSFDAISAYNGTYDTNLLQRHGGPTRGFADQYRRGVGIWSGWLRENAPRTKLILPLSFSYDDTRTYGRNNTPYFMNDEQAMYFADMVRNIITDVNSNGCQITNIEPAVNFTSFNEHFEGSSVIPGVHYRDSSIPYGRYMDILYDTFRNPIEIEYNCTRDRRM